MAMAMENLTEAMSSLWGESEHTDLTIVCGKMVFNVHCLVMCLNSKYFEVASHGNWRESTTRRIDLSVDKPLMVERMLKFCYGIDYSAGAHRAAEPDHISRAHTHAEMYALAEKYGMQGLKKSAKANFSSEIQVWVDYTGAATMPRFTELVSFIYDEIPASDRPLRDLVIAYAYKDWKLLSRQKEFMAFLAANFDFAFDMIDSKPSTIKEKARPVCDKPCSRCRSSEKWKLTSTRVTCDCGRFEDITHNVALA